MRKLSELIPLLAIDLPGADTPELTQQLRLTFREFCMFTEAWTEELPAIDIVADQDEYYLPVSWDAHVGRILWLKLDDTEQNTVYYYLKGENVLFMESEIVPDTASTDGLTTEVVLIPNLFAEDVDEEFLERYGPAIVSGVKMEMMRKPKKPYTDVETARRIHAPAWETAKALARREATLKHRKANLKVQMKPWR